MKNVNVKAEFEKYWQVEGHSFMNPHIMDSIITELNDDIYALALADIPENLFGCVIYIFDWKIERSWRLLSRLEMHKLYLLTKMYPLTKMYFTIKAKAQKTFKKMKLKLHKPELYRLECDNIVDYI